jgi:hypothetical protein
VSINERNSFGRPSRPPRLYQACIADESGAEARAIQNAVAAGVVMVTAAGVTPLEASTADISTDSRLPDLLDPVTVPSADVAQIDSNGLACRTLAGESLTGESALTQRGACSFNAKLDNAAAAGLVAAVVFNNQNTGRLAELSNRHGPGEQHAAACVQQCRRKPRYLHRNRELHRRVAEPPSVDTIPRRFRPRPALRKPSTSQRPAPPTVTPLAARSKVLKTAAAGDIPGTTESISNDCVSETYEEFDVAVGSVATSVYAPVFSLLKHPSL